MKVGSMFSGIDGLGLGLERAGMTVSWHAEIDPYCSRELVRHWPHVPNLGDVTAIDWSTVEPVDLICGGFPCPPVSQAGRRRGSADERWRWPAMADAVRVLRPRLVLVENVEALLHFAVEFGDVLGDLAALGYDAEWSVVSACSLGAPHPRARVFVLAYAEGTHVEGALPSEPLDEERWPEPRGSRRGAGRSKWWLSEPGVDRMADGVPRRMVRPALEAYGNAVVPQVAEWVGRRIMNELVGSLPERTEP